ncbi:immunoglobulin domain-containing protein [Salmonella enterica]|nr:immunoglobulin domain-containing protein [Salmonella enterica]
MTLFPLTCLLAILSVVFAIDPMFGPREVSGVEGNSMSIKCKFLPISINKHAVKYWCRKLANGYCKTLISSNGYISEDYAGRANITSFPDKAMFVVYIVPLTRRDAGNYKCGLDSKTSGLAYSVRVGVIQDQVSTRYNQTNIRMSDFENAGDFGDNDIMGASPVTEETILEGKHELTTTTESTVDPEESKKTRRSSKEEADMAYSAFLLQSRNTAAQVHDGPKEA